MLGQRLRHRIDIQDITVPTDDDGAQTETWADFLTDEPADFIAQSGREYVQSAAVQDQNFARFVIRRQEGITARMRIKFEGALYQITAVLPDPTNRRHLTLMVNTGVIPETDGP